MTHIPPDLDPQHIADDAPDTITVCAACRQAACWEGEIQCEDYRTAGTIEVPAPRTPDTTDERRDGCEVAWERYVRKHYARHLRLDHPSLDMERQSWNECWTAAKEKP